LFDPERKDGQNLYAATKAGYGADHGQTSDQALRVTGAKLRANKKIQEAIREVFVNVIHDLGPDAARELRLKLNDRKASDQIKAILSVVDRLSPIEETHIVKLQDQRAPSEADIAQTLARINELARKAGLSLPAPSPPIDADYRVVEP
jgi:phage terminase small subunit